MYNYYVLNSIIYADLPGFFSPCIVTGHHLRRDMLLSIGSATIFIIELAVGFETNTNLNAERKKDKYIQLTRALSSKYRSVKFINLSISSLGIFGKSCSSFIAMCNYHSTDKQHLYYALRQITAITIRSTYYIFRMRNIFDYPRSSYLLNYKDICYFNSYV